MKTTQYKFEKHLEATSESTNLDWLRNEFKAILESEKHFTSKADYIGYSFIGLDEKIDAIELRINELKELKTTLKNSYNKALEIGAEVLSGYNVDRLEGGGISSITITPQSTKSKTEITIYEPDKLIYLGYYKTVIDEDKIRLAMSSSDEREKLLKYCDMKIITTQTPSRLRINKRRNNGFKEANNAIDSKSNKIELVGEVA